MAGRAVSAVTSTPGHNIELGPGGGVEPPNSPPENEAPPWLRQCLTQFLPLFFFTLLPSSMSRRTKKIPALCPNRGVHQMIFVFNNLAGKSTSINGS